MKKKSINTFNKIRLFLGIIILIIGIFLLINNYIKINSDLKISNQVVSVGSNKYINDYIKAWSSFQNSEVFNGTSSDTKIILKINYANSVFNSALNYYNNLVLIIYLSVIIIILGLIIILQSVNNLLRKN